MLSRGKSRLECPKCPETFKNLKRGAGKYRGMINGGYIFLTCFRCKHTTKLKTIPAFIEKLEELLATDKDITPENKILIKRMIEKSKGGDESHEFR